MMDLKIQKAKSTINNGRLLIVFTALPIIGSLLKFFYIKDTAVVDIENPLIALISSFPLINTSELFVLDNFIILGFLIGLFVGISTLKRGISEMIELKK